MKAKVLCATILLLLLSAAAHASLHVRGMGIISGDSGRYPLIYGDLPDIEELDFLRPAGKGRAKKFINEYRDFSEILPIGGSTNRHHLVGPTTGFSDLGWFMSGFGTYEKSRPYKMKDLLYSTLLTDAHIYGALMPILYWSGNDDLDHAAFLFSYWVDFKPLHLKKAIRHWMAVHRQDIHPVPIPGAVWFLATGMIGILGIRKRLS